MPLRVNSFSLTSSETNLFIKIFLKFTESEIKAFQCNCCLCFENLKNVYLQEFEEYERRLAEPWVSRAYVKLYEKFELFWLPLELEAEKYPNCCGCCRCWWLCAGTGTTQLLASLVLIVQFVTTRHMTDTNYNSNTDS